MCLPRFCTLMVVLCVAQLGSLIMAYGYAADSSHVFANFDDALPVGYAFGMPDKLATLQTTLLSCLFLQVFTALAAIFSACAR